MPSPPTDRAWCTFTQSHQIEWIYHRQQRGSMTCMPLCLLSDTGESVHFVNGLATALLPRPHQRAGSFLVLEACLQILRVLTPREHLSTLSSWLNETPSNTIEKAIFFFCSFYPFSHFNKCYFLKWIFRHIHCWNIPLLLCILLASLLIVLMLRSGITANDIYLRKLGENSSELNNVIRVSDCNLL